MNNNPLFLYLAAMFLLCIISIVAVVVALRAAAHNDSVIDDPTVEDLERLYNAPSYESGRR